MTNQFSPLLTLPNISVEEINFLEQIMSKLPEEEKQQFYLLYSSKRRDSFHILLATLCGFFGVAGIQRVLLDKVFLGILYFFTGGFLFVGTIWDLLNYKRLTAEYNNNLAYECLRMLRVR